MVQICPKPAPFMKIQPTVFGQLLSLLPLSHFEHLVQVHRANHGQRGFTAHAHLVCLLYAQLTRRDGLRDLVACLNAQGGKLYHLGIRTRLSRSTLADASEQRPYQLFEDLGHRLVQMALQQVAHEPQPLELRETLYALDSTTISLCMSLFPWAKYRRHSAAIKVHTAIELRAAIPVVLRVTHGRTADVKMLDEMRLPAGSMVVMDRAYVDYERLHVLVGSGVSFVTRAKTTMVFRTCADRGIDKTAYAQGVRSDLCIEFALMPARSAYPQQLRRVRYIDPDTLRELVFLTNRQDLPALVIAQIYKQRWKVELFFKWLKQNLSIKHFFGTTENAVKSQIWAAICAYLLVVIAHRSLKLDIKLHTLMHLLETALFDRVAITELVKAATQYDIGDLSGGQAELF
jgi:Domain of unknown function (DUF4372)/Transposase DDE domain